MMMVRLMMLMRVTMQDEKAMKRCLPMQAPVLRVWKMANVDYSAAAGKRM